MIKFKPNASQNEKDKIYTYFIIIKFHTSKHSSTSSEVHFFTIGQCLIHADDHT